MDLIGVCGDNCTYCPRFIENNKGSTQRLETVKELWVRIGLRDDPVAIGAMLCNGCKPENNCAYAALRDCAAQRKLQNCGLCGAYPCKLVEDCFAGSAELYPRIRSSCTEDELRILEKAFFCKKANLDSQRKSPAKV
jgi:hypothetical protein